MKCKSGVLVVFLVALFIAFTSCVKDNEMNLDTSIASTSKISTAIFAAKLEASTLIENSTPIERMILTDTIHLDLISSDFFHDELNKSNLTFQFKNSVNRDFKIDFEFLNDKNELKFELQIPIVAGTQEHPSTVETSVMIEAPELSVFKESTKLIYSISLLPSEESQLENAEGTLELQSDATYFFDM